MSILHGIAWVFLRERMRQPSTWAGVVSFAAGMLGLHLEPQYADAIIGVAVALSSLVCVLVDERGKSVVVLDTKPADDVLPLPGHPVPAEPRPGIRPVQQQPIGPG